MRLTHLCRCTPIVDSGERMRRVGLSRQLRYESRILLHDQCTSSIDIVVVVVVVAGVGVARQHGSVRATCVEQRHKRFTVLRRDIAERDKSRERERIVARIVVDSAKRPTKQRWSERVDDLCLQATIATRDVGESARALTLQYCIRLAR